MARRSPPPNPPGRAIPVSGSGARPGSRRCSRARRWRRRDRQEARRQPHQCALRKRQHCARAGGGCVCESEREPAQVVVVDDVEEKKRSETCGNSLDEPSASHPVRRSRRRRCQSGGGSPAEPCNNRGKGAAAESGADRKNFAGEDDRATNRDDEERAGLSLRQQQCSCATRSSTSSAIWSAGRSPATRIAPGSRRSHLR